MSIAPGRLVLGMGVSSGADAEAAHALASEMLRAAGVGADALEAIATLDRRASHPALVALAGRLAVPLRGLAPEMLARQAGRLARPSGVVEGHVGLAGVAEAAALALAGESGRLVVEKRTGQGVTAALAIAG